MNIKVGIQNKGTIVSHYYEKQKHSITGTLMKNILLITRRSEKQLNLFFQTK